jgi:hypothetical protein
MSNDQTEGRVNRGALAVLAPLLFVAFVVKAIVIGGSVLDMIIAVSVVTVIYGTLIGIDLYRDR